MFMKSIALPALLASVIISGAATAETRPQAGGRDSRIMYATFQEGQVYKVNTRLRHSTLIELGKGERVLSVSLGDSTSFKPEEISTPNAFYIKPLVAGAVTNATVETNKRFYFLQLVESSKTTPSYLVKFTVPGSGRSGGGRGASFAPPPPPSPMRYAISAQSTGSKFAPVRIWDDGQKTYFAFSADAPIPAVFRVDSAGREYTVQTRSENSVTTVSSRSQRWVLRVGGEYICIDAQ